MMDDEDEMTITPGARARVHRAVDAWIEECARQGTIEWSHGRSGVMGQLKLHAVTDDDGVSVVVERTVFEHCEGD